MIGSVSSGLVYLWAEMGGDGVPWAVVLDQNKVLLTQRRDAMMLGRPAVATASIFPATPWATAKLFILKLLLTGFFNSVTPVRAVISFYYLLVKSRRNGSSLAFWVILCRLKWNYKCPTHFLKKLECLHPRPVSLQRFRKRAFEAQPSFNSDTWYSFIELVSSVDRWSCAFYIIV